MNNNEMNNQDLFEQTKPMESNSNKKVIFECSKEIYSFFFVGVVVEE